MRYAAESKRLFDESREIQWRPVAGSAIADFYTGKNVLVTGATGFLGKLLVEKLLRACPDLNAIYILVRPKKGEDELSRVDKMFADEVFGPLTKLFPKFIHKISIIKGDISLPDLGISAENLEALKDQVNVVFHVAATVRFDEKISTATSINIRATRDLLNIARSCKNLESFVHVSTAYTHCNRKEIDESFYEVPMSGDELIKLMESTPVNNTSRLLHNWPNTYTFTKALAENIVQTHGQGLPVCIVRPAIVIATYKEPLRSWIDNLYGATGIVVGAGTGLLKTLNCDKRMTAELVPGDYVINNMIAASYRTAKDQPTDIPIYNYVSSVENHHTWQDFMQGCRTWGEEIPTIRCVWYYSLTMNRYYWVHMLYTFFLHFLPALLMDFGLVVARQKPMMFKIYKKINKFESVVSYFAMNEWKFSNRNVQSLWEYVSEADRKMFPFCMKELDWEEFHKTHVLGLRTYVVKDDISSLPQAMVKWKRFYIANRILKAVFHLALIYLAYLILSKLLKLIVIS